jgi:hypothetical protein
MVDERETIRAHLTVEATRRFGAERAAGLARDIEALAADLAHVATAPVPDDAAPGFFLLDAPAAGR